MYEWRREVGREKREGGREKGREKGKKKNMTPEEAPFSAIAQLRLGGAVGEIMLS